MYFDVQCLSRIICELSIIPDRNRNITCFVTYSFPFSAPLIPRSCAAQEHLFLYLFPRSGSSIQVSHNSFQFLKENKTLLNHSVLQLYELSPHHSQSTFLFFAIAIEWISESTHLFNSFRIPKCSLSRALNLWKKNVSGSTPLSMSPMASTTEY